MKMKYVFLSCHQNAEQNLSVKLANQSFRNLANFKYFGMIVINLNYMYEKVKNRLHLRNVCYSSIKIFCLPFSCRTQGLNYK